MSAGAEAGHCVAAGMVKVRIAECWAVHEAAPSATTCHEYVPLASASECDAEPVVAASARLPPFTPTHNSKEVACATPFQLNVTGELTLDSPSFGETSAGAEAGHCTAAGMVKVRVAECWAVHEAAPSATTCHEYVPLASASECDVAPVVAASARLPPFTPI